MPTTVTVSLLRGINVGGRNQIRMEALRALHGSLGLEDAQTYVQSGNVVFRTRERDAVKLSRRIEDAIERSVGFRPAVIVRTAAELRGVIARNPFAARRGIEPSRLLVLFLAGDPGAEARRKVSAIPADPDEVRVGERELYIYYPNGMGHPKVSWMALEKILGVAGTGRNWNTVVKLAAMAERLEAAG